MGEYDFDSNTGRTRSGIRQDKTPRSMTGVWWDNSIAGIGAGIWWDKRWRRKEYDG